VKAVIDDCSGTLTLFFNKEMTERLLNIKFEDADSVTIKNALDKLYLSKLRVRGNVISDDYGLTMIVHNVEPVDIDIVSRARNILDEIESDLS
jgi:replication factor A1